MPEITEKIEDLLALSLSATAAEIDRSPILRTGIVGFETETPVGAGGVSEEPIWEVIVKYHGDISGIANENVKVEELIAGYAIITLPESFIEPLATLEQIEFIEKPKSVFPGDYEGNVASCIYQVRQEGLNLTGKGVLIAIIDSGIDIFQKSFQNPDGTTRILFLYDQVLQREFTREDINLALAAPNRQTAVELVPSRDITGHGTAVACIAAGKIYGESPNQDAQQMEGVAFDSQLLVVKLDTKGQNSFPMTTNLMRAFQYVTKKAIDLAMPVAVNLSFGNTYGSHDGTSLVERFLDNIAEIGRTAICIGSGNEGASAGHVSGKIRSADEEIIEFIVGSYERAFNLQLWKNYVDDYRISLIAPNGERIDLPRNSLGFERFIIENQELLVYVGTAKPYGVNQEIFFDLLPIDTYLTPGIWRLILTPVRVVVGEYKLYMPSEVVRSRDTRFLTPTLERTLTIPSTSEKIITVGAYDSRYAAYADFSGRGYIEQAAGVIGRTKPDIVAPGVGIVAAAGEGMGSFTGTSFAAPFVTGSAALLMEWGDGVIIRLLNIEMECCYEFAR